MYPFKEKLNDVILSTKGFIIGLLILILIPVVGLTIIHTQINEYEAIENQAIEEVTQMWHDFDCYKKKTFLTAVEYDNHPPKTQSLLDGFYNDYLVNCIIEESED